MLEVQPIGVRGLSTAAAQVRLERDGPNALPAAPPEREWRRVLRQLKSPLIYVLLFAVALDLVVWGVRGAHGVPAEALIIAAILLVNALLGAWQERRAEHALRRLRHLAAPQVWAWRDGTLQRLAASALVPDDAVRLEAGERVPADLALIAAENVLVDESVITGESLPIEKTAGTDLLAGTVVVRGRAVARVSRTGSRSALGTVARLLGEERAEPTPLERRLQRFGRVVAHIVVTLAFLLLGTGLLAGGWDRAGELFLFAVALAVAAVPEGLPAVLTMTLALGVERMARHHAVVRRLAAVEALGSVTVIATDKTGTLTENRLRVHAVETTNHEGALRAMVLANDAEAGSEAGDPLEVALLAHAAAAGVHAAALRETAPRLSSRAFESTSRFMRVSVVEGDVITSYMKGATEVLLERATLPPRERAEWAARTGAAAAAGFRTLGFARASGETETAVEWLGFAALWDPPRPEVPAAVRQALDAGIRVVMITGDHPATACTVARHVGLPDGPVATGTELAGHAHAELRRVVREVGIFARVDPEQKLRIVAALQAEGEIVAVTGDGVNDAPALKRADVGIAMGRRGSDVAREVADLLLLDDNFATIVRAVEEGRSIFANIQKFVRFLFSTNLVEVLVVLVAASAAFAFDLRDSLGALLIPLTAAQLLWINLLTDGAPALALALDRNPGVMRERPRPPAAPLLDRASIGWIVGVGLVTALVMLSLLALLWAGLGVSAPVAATATFAAVALSQLLCAHTVRRCSVRSPPNWTLHVAVTASFAAQLLILAVPALGGAFDVAPLSTQLVWLVALAVLVAWIGAELITRLLWPRGNRRAR